MGIPLRVLIVEDSEDDVRLLARELKRVPQVFPRSFGECATTGPATPVSTAALLRTTAPIHLEAPLH